jgi:hypothetical protein
MGVFSSSLLDWGLVALHFGFLAAVWLRLLGHRTSTDDYLALAR